MMLRAPLSFSNYKNNIVSHIDPLIQYLTFRFIQLSLGASLPCKSEWRYHTSLDSPRWF